MQHAPPATAESGVGYYGPDGFVTTQIRRDEARLEPSPLERSLSKAASHSWGRLEYLLWEVEEPGDKLLGAPLDSVIDEREPFPIFDFQDPPNEIGTAVVPDTSTISMNDTNGIRATWGLDMTFGTFETNFFALEQAGDTFRAPNLRPQVEETLVGGLVLIIEPGNFAATSLLENGQPSNLVELYNRAFVVDYENDVLGAEANFVLKTLRVGFPKGLELQPILGARYLLIQEQMTQTGVFEDITGAVPTLTSVIDSDTFNNIAGPTLGFRAEYQHPWFTLGVEPKITLGANAFKARVKTERFRSAADPTVVTEDESVTFSPVGEVQLYARVNVTENFTLSVGYSLVEAFRVTRPADNIFYNDNGPFPTPPGVVLDVEKDNLRLDGLTIGGEIRFK